MNVFILFASWSLLQIYDTKSFVITSNVVDPVKNYSIEKQDSLESNNDAKFNVLNPDRIADEPFSPDIMKSIQPSELTYNNNRDVPISLYETLTSDTNPPSNQNTKSIASDNVKTQNQNKLKGNHYKLAEILTAAGLFNKNITEPLIHNKNVSHCVCTALDEQNATALERCCCSKDMQQKCEGVDLSYLIPIPGDNVTKSTTYPTKKKLTLPVSTLAPRATIPNSGKAQVSADKADLLRNGREYRKVEESTLDALRRFQLSHGIFAPNEEEMEKAVENAKMQLAKAKNKLPDWMARLKHESLLARGLHDNYVDRGKVIKDGSELYKLLPQFKIEKIINENNAFKVQSEPLSHGGEISLLSQNAAAIKKQLETIRQYDVLLANIRAQAQLKLIELADLENKHRMEEVRFKKERDYGLDELKNMEEVLRQEIKLARNLPGAYAINWADDNIDGRNYHANFSDFELQNQNLVNYEKPNKEYSHESFTKNNKLLEELDSLLHESENLSTTYKDPSVFSKQVQNKVQEDNKMDKLSLLEKALGRAVRYNRKVDENKHNLNTSDISLNIRPKRKCSTLKPANVKKLMKGEYHSPAIGDYDKAFQNLQNDLMQLKDHILLRSKYATDPDDNVLVQVKVSVDVANSTSSDRNCRRVNSSSSKDDSKMEKNNKKLKSPK